MKGRFKQSTAWWRCPSRILIVAIMLAAHGQLAGSFYDPIVTGRGTTLDYLDQASTLVGADVFDAVPFQYTLYIGLRMGQIDRLSVDPRQVIEHIQEAMAVRDRFYGELAEDDFRANLLPLRLRYESLRRSGWRKQLRGELDPLIDTVGTVEGAVEGTLRHIRQHVELSDSRLTYPLRERFDQDPLSVWRGRRADEIDYTLLAVAALRAVGIQARIVWVPTFSGLPGGKLWLEWRNADGDWIPWAATGPTDAIDHRQWLHELADGHWTLVLHSPEKPQVHTAAYAATATVHAAETRSTDMRGAVEGSVMVLNSGALRPVFARELGLRTLHNSEAVVAPGRIWITRGGRDTCAGLLPWQLHAGQPVWYVLDQVEHAQPITVAEAEPRFFSEARRTRPGDPGAAVAATAVRLPARRARNFDDTLNDFAGSQYVRLRQPWNVRNERDIQPTGVRMAWRATDMEFLFEAESESPPQSAESAPLSDGDAIRLLLWPEGGSTVIDLTVAADGGRQQIFHHLGRDGNVLDSTESQFHYFDIAQRYDPESRQWRLHVRIPAKRMGTHNLRDDIRLRFAAYRYHKRDEPPAGVSSTTADPVPDPGSRSNWGTITLSPPAR